MAYIVIVIDPYVFNDPDQFREYQSEVEADAAARNISKANPSAKVMTANAIKRYKSGAIVSADSPWPATNQEVGTT